MRDTVVRRVQDISGESGQLPQDVLLPDVTDRRYKLVGGEAFIYLARLRGRQVVSREYLPPEDGDWESPDGKLILNVSPRQIP